MGVAVCVFPNSAHPVAIFLSVALAYQSAGHPLGVGVFTGVTVSVTPLVVPLSLAVLYI